MARTVLSARHADAEEPEAGFGVAVLATPGVFIPRVAAVDDDVTLTKHRFELLQHAVDRLAGLDHHHDLARRLEPLNQIRKALGANQSATTLLDGGPRQVRLEVVHGDRVPVVQDVEGQVATHDSHPDHPDLQFVSHGGAPSVCC